MSLKETPVAPVETQQEGEDSMLWPQGKGADMQTFGRHVLMIGPSVDLNTPH